MSAHGETLTRFQPRLFAVSIHYGQTVAERTPEKPIYAYSHAEATQVAARLYFAGKKPAKPERVHVKVKIPGHGWNDLLADSHGNVFGYYGHPLLSVVKPPKPKEPDLSQEAECMLSLIGRCA